MRHTKIIATIGPASSEPDMIEALLVAGVDVLRLNFSHATHQWHADAYARIRERAVKHGRHVAVMQDLSGPKIRTGTLADGGTLLLAAGDELVIAAGNAPGTRGRVFTPYAELIESARPGDRLLLDDGRIELRVVSASSSELGTVVITGGALGPNKGINAPGITLPASALTAKDEKDLQFGLELGIDLVALSFVQTADDVRRALSAMDAFGRRVPIIAKIERPAAIANLEEILTLAHGVMVARGDLGLEMPLEQVPRRQKEIIRRSRAASRPVIVATQVLESMRVDPRPTRAEVSDAANSVDDGADAIMLTGETASGAHPVRAVQMLDSIIRDAELLPPTERVVPTTDPTGRRHGRALCEAAVTLAVAGQANAIVAVTREGKTARLLSALRPPCPIFAATERTDVAGMLSLFWGVRPCLTAERDVERLERLLLDRHLLPAAAVAVFVNVSPDLSRADGNFLNVQQLG